ncbi:dephospho-CoA kinase [Candidatus Manganitrophus noduliformans]|uniref:Dephospho-CoA kinase n=1 Tax=Candidatus Manganitrophus noduliformans TaxID=2606439 RepID=A0A7X6DLJ5_9BACT|nr:dephospho-CoA kinase [Candidatus Manganitrophus noduliformans]NKE69377.1 dephospho-CoA kinase [Candidatus Manganitrophus noduliformans]
MIWVGLTGGIASGKSTVSRLFRETGAFVIDADEIAHAVIRKGAPAYAGVVEAFGAAILDKKGEIDRKRLGEIVFNDARRRERLNQLVHPHVYAQAEKEKRAIAAAHPEAVILFDVPLLIETGAHREMDLVIVVYADRATQIERLIERDGLTREEAERRIDAQMPLDEKRRFADEIIDTRAPLPGVEGAVRSLYQRLHDRAISRRIS